MNQKTYVIIFCTLAFLFVPIFFTYLFGSETKPCSLVVIFILSALPYSLIFLPFYVIYYGIFCLIYWGAARFTFKLCERLKNPRAILLAQMAILAAVFSCSFLQVIHVDDGFSDHPLPDRYDTFWTALGDPVPLYH